MKEKLQNKFDKTLEIPLNDASQRIKNLEIGDTTPFSRNLHNGKTTHIQIKALVQDAAQQTIIIAGDTIQ